MLGSLDTNAKKTRSAAIKKLYLGAGNEYANHYAI